MNTSLMKAYDLERKGLEFYISSAVTVNSPLARRALFSLAREEIEHMIKIDDISLCLTASGKWPPAESALGSSDIEISIKEFFEKTKKDAMGQGNDSADVVKTAMEFEKKSYELYSDLRDSSIRPSEKEFYAQLMIQENEHYVALENVYYYLTKTGDWFGKEESGVWSWMNL